jgi:hypothetical protein
MQLRAARTLVCAAPLAADGGELGDRGAALLALHQRVAAAQADGAVCVILCSPLAGAPSIYSQLAGEPAGITVHPQIARALRAYRQLALLPSEAENGPRRYTGPLAPGAILLWPAAVPLPATSRLQGKKARGVVVVLAAGAAMLPPVVARVVASLPGGTRLGGAVALADGLDQAGLLRYIKDSEASTVYMTAGYSDSLAATLRRARVELAPLGPPRQLPLFG